MPDLFWIGFFLGVGVASFCFGALLLILTKGKT